MSSRHPTRYAASWGAIMYTWAIMILLMLVRSTVARERPSEVDLQAAYCIPIAQHSLHMLRSFKRNVQFPDIKLAAEKAIAGRAEDLQRLQRYLVPRMPSLDLLEVEAAGKRGEEDLKKVAAYVETCKPKCKPLSNKPPAALWTACIEQCKAGNPLTPRMQTCSELGWLPF